MHVYCKIDNVLNKSVQDMGVNVTSNNQDVILNSDIIILAVKPHQILDVMKEIHDTYTTVQQQAGSRTTTTPRSFRPLIVSVATSITLADIEEKVSFGVYFPSFILPDTIIRENFVNFHIARSDEKILRRNFLLVIQYYSEYIACIDTNKNIATKKNF